MNQWQQNAGAMFPPQGVNPAAMYGNMGTPSQFDVGNGPFQQPGLANGGGANTNNTGSPTPAGYPGQTFQTGSVVPAKRNHDGMSGSPQQNHASRSQTPSYSGFPGQPGGQQFPNAPTPFQHLQQPGSNNATPSPTLSNQQFRPPQGQQQRMQNASPSPFPQQQQPQQQQQAPAGNFGNQMSPGTPQQANLSNNMGQQSAMGGWNQGMGMNTGMSPMPSNLQGAMSGQMNNMANMQQQQQQQQMQQRQYQMKLLQQQAQLRNNGGMAQRQVAGQQNPMANFAGQQAPAAPNAMSPMANGQGGNNNPMAMVAATQQQQQQQQIKRAGFLKHLQANATQQGRPFNPAPPIAGRPVDLWALWSLAAQVGGSQVIERNGQWQSIANKLGFAQPQFPEGASEVKSVYTQHLMQYERMWLAARVHMKQEQARNYASQMAGTAGVGTGGPPQGSPTKTMQPPSQPNQFNQFPPGQQGQQMATPLQNQQQPMGQQAQAQAFQQPSHPSAQATPVQANAQLPPNGMVTPQQVMQQRRNSTVRKQEAMTPQHVPHPSMAAPSPHPEAKVQRSPSIKQEPEGPVMKMDEPQTTEYLPNSYATEHDGGYDLATLCDLGNTISRAMPNAPLLDEMGLVDLKAISLSLASGIHSEVRCALDVLSVVSRDERVHFDLTKCEDLVDILVDCAEEQSEALSENATEVSDALDLPSYEDVLRGTRTEADTLQEISECGTSEYTLDRAADKLIAVTTILRNFSFYEQNHDIMLATPLVKWISNTLRLVGTRNMLLRTHYNTLDFYKDIITLLSNITQRMTLPSREDALHVLHFILAFAPQPAPSFTSSAGKVRFPAFDPTIHRFLPPAVDCLAKLLARTEPNRAHFRSIFTAVTSTSASVESPVDLLTRTFALAVSVLPDRSRGSLGSAKKLRIVEARKAYLTQGMLAADILTTLLPANGPPGRTDADLAQAWIESEDGWAVGLLNLVAVLSLERSQPHMPPHMMKGPGGRGDLGHDTEAFKIIAQRALVMIKRLAEKSGRGGLMADDFFKTALSSGKPNGVSSGDDEDDGQASDAAENELFVDGLPVAKKAKTLHPSALPSPPTSPRLSTTSKWEGIPQAHSIIGALLLDNADKTAIGLLCGLHDMAMAV